MNNQPPPAKAGVAKKPGLAPQRAPDPGPPVWYKRKYLVYPKFQMTLIVMNSLVTVVLFTMTVLLMVKSHLYLENAVKQTRLPAQNIFIQMLDNQLRSLLIYMGIATFSAVLITGIATLLFSHKLAGPMIKLRRYFGDIEKNGDFHEDLNFRKTDFFLDLPPTINRALHALKKK